MEHSPKDASSSEEVSLATTPAGSSLTESSNPKPSSLGKAAACRSSTETEPTSYEKAFKVLSAALGREFISGDVLYFIACSLKEECGPEMAREFAEHAVLNRGKSTHDFMG